MGQSTGKKVYYLESPVTGWAQMPYNTKEVLTESGEWESPVTGWVKVTCIGGGAAGASLHNGWIFGAAGSKTIFGDVESDGAPSIRMSFGGAASIPVMSYMYVERGDIIQYSVGAGGVASLSSPSTDIDIIGYPFPGGAVTDNTLNAANTWYFGFGVGGNNGTVYGGGGGSSGDSTYTASSMATVNPKKVSGLGAGGGASGNMFFGSKTGTRGPVLGGDGGAGAIILEYADPQKKA